MPLERLQHHLTECDFNPNAEVICDKGCNIKITQDEYEASNCFTHLANRQQKQQEQITKLSVEVRRQQDEISKLNDELSSVRGQVPHSECAISEPREEITTLNDELSSVPFEVERPREDFTKLSEEVARMQREEISKLSEEHGRKRKDCTKLTYEDNIQQEEEENMKVIDAISTKWQICENMKTLVDQPLVLEHGGDREGAFAQTFHSLDPATPVVKIQVLYVGNLITIGLTPKGHSSDTIPGFTHNSIGFCSDGYVFANNKSQNVGQVWKNGDIIECRIKFPDSFITDGETKVEVNFTHNGQLAVSKDIEMPIDGFFPTVFMSRFSHQFCKIQFLNFL